MIGYEYGELQRRLSAQAEQGQNRYPDSVECAAAWNRACIVMKNELHKYFYGQTKISGNRCKAATELEDVVKDIIPETEEGRQFERHYRLAIQSLNQLDEIEQIIKDADADAGCRFDLSPTLKKIKEVLRTE